MPTSRFASQRRVPLKGSERKRFDLKAGGELDSRAESRVEGRIESRVESQDEPITVSVLLAAKQPIDPKLRLTREEFAERHGARAEAEAGVRAFAEEFGLRVDAPRERGRRTLQLTGSREAMERAFGVTLRHERDKDGKTVRLREGAIELPGELAPHVVAVLGLDTRQQARPHFRVATPRAGNVSYTPVQVGVLYGFPASSKATGQTIALLELGGGYREADLTAYFESLNLPAPSVTAISVDKGTNSPGEANGADGEVMLDIEVSAAIAVGAKVAVYFAPNTDQGFIDAVTTAVHDSTNQPSVLSISWGGPESSWTEQAVTALDQACQAAASLGVTITVACGDDGSSDGVSSGNHVDFPASSPHVLACGGTKMVASGSAITSETVWNELAENEGATGGGVSALFSLPSWQGKSNVPRPTTSQGGRGVPDVAGDADPSTGYTVRVDGETTTIGGTSAVAPLWAGLIALANAANGSDAGFVNPALYGTAAAFHDITSGNNGAFKAGPGWDACTGLGSPKGAAVIVALGATT